jgi:5-methylphenazine-1-carboxylate 1-monooxygenase
MRLTVSSREAQSAYLERVRHLSQLGDPGGGERELQQLGAGPVGTGVALLLDEPLVGQGHEEPVGRGSGHDGVHSSVRRQFYPDEGEPRYSGVTMWRGTTVAPPFLVGASMARVRWPVSGKMVVCPIRDVDDDGNQLGNWVAEFESPQRARRGWTREGRLEDFLGVFQDRTFDWLDVPTLITGAETVLEYPVVDQDPLPRWTFGRVTLLGDAAHPMVPRGSNGAGQAVLDAHRLAELLAAAADPLQALADYEAERLPRTSAVVLANRTSPPDTIIREVWERTGYRPFGRIEDVISEDEIAAISRRYQEIAGYSLDELRAVDGPDGEG